MLRARLEAARWALKHGLVRAILVSGDEGGGEVTAMRTWLEDEGVDPSRILADPGGARTIVTMRNAAQFFRITSAIVCTQPISMNRSLYLARKNGIDAVGLAAEVDGPHNLRWLSAEAVKNTLAVVETAL
jgi:SanA protein